MNSSEASKTLRPSSHTSNQVPRSGVSAGMDSEALRAFSCGICLENFDKEKRYPVSLVCGHTFCSKCVRKLAKSKPTIVCGVCRKHTRTSYKRLGKNILLTDLMDRNKLLVHPGREDSLVDDASSSVGSVSEQGDDQPFPSCNDAGMEELYEMLDNIQDAVTFTPDRQLSRSRELQLERLKDEVGQFEERIAEMQRDFRTINTRARQLQSEVTPSNGQSLWEERFLLSVSGEDADPHSLSNMIGFALRRFQDTGRSLGWIPVEETGGRDSVNSIYLNHNGWTSVDRERWLTNNYLRIAATNDLDVSRIHCYLCNVYFVAHMVDDVSDVSLNSDMRRHIHGQRHQSLIRENLSAAPDEVMPIDGQVMPCIHFPLQFINSQIPDQAEIGRFPQNRRIGNREESNGFAFRNHSGHSSASRGQDQQNRLFENFYQATDAGTQAVPAQRVSSARLTQTRPPRPPAALPARYRPSHMRHGEPPQVQSRLPHGETSSNQTHNRHQPPAREHSRGFQQSREAGSMWQRGARDEEADEEANAHHRVAAPSGYRPRTANTLGHGNIGPSTSTQRRRGHENGYHAPRTVRNSHSFPNNLEGSSGSSNVQMQWQPLDSDWD